MQNAERDKILNLLQFIFEILVIVGYVLGIIPGLFYATIVWVLPMTIANTVFAAITKNKTLTYTSINIGMAILTLVPILGYFALAVGIYLSVMSINIVYKLVDKKAFAGIGIGQTVDAKSETKKETKKDDN